ncbi:hypothetical protein [Kribbella sp. NPDC006257]|uniref:hypothetical protein n=1 Tax=Kribbella sp. NPDC006257 TaxID=3156738 RepID=UPI0033AA5760
MRGPLPVAAVLIMLACGCTREEPQPLELGTGASLPIGSFNGGQGAVTITPERVRRGEPADLATAIVRNNDGSTAQPPTGTPYYVRVDLCREAQGRGC